LAVSASRVKVGSVTQRRRKDGTIRFGVRYWVRGETEPRWELQPLGSSKRAAEKRLQELSGAAQRGEVAMERGVLFELYADRWLAEQKALIAAGALKPSTYADYLSSVEIHLKPFFEGLHLDEMTRADCRAFTAKKIEDGRLKPSSINNLLVPLRLILRQAAEDGCTILSPETGIKRVKAPRHEAEWYEAAEVDQLVSRTPEKWRALIGLAVHAGLRRGEILALQWGDIDWANNRIHVRRNLISTYKANVAGVDERLWSPKTRRSNRLVPMRPVLRSLLEKHRAFAVQNELDLVFVTRSSKPIDPDNFIRHVYDPAVRRAGLRRITFHSLRHSFVTYCAAAGVPLAKVGDWVGHSDSRITEIYRHASADSEEFAIGLLDRFEANHREVEAAAQLP
jgi:integrase